MQTRKAGNANELGQKGKFPEPHVIGPPFFFPPSCYEPVPQTLSKFVPDLPPSLFSVSFTYVLRNGTA
jgi:hypothetical protein